MQPYFKSRHFILALLVTCVTFFGGASVVAQEATSDDAVALFNRGQDLHEKGDLKGAIAEYDKALKIIPEFPEAEYQRAAAEIALGDLIEAERSLRHATEIRPEWPLAWGMLSDVLVRRYLAAAPADRSAKRADTDAAIKRALELDPANVSAVTALVELQLNSGATKDELTTTLGLVKPLTDGKMSPAASLWTARAALENALGDRKAGKASISRALELDPKSTTAIFLAGDLAVPDDLERAKQIAASLAVAQADHSRIDLLNARIAAAEGRFPDALAYLEKIPATAASIELRKQIDAASSSDPAEFEKLLATDQKNVVALNKLCSLYRRQDPLKALEYCKRAAEIEPTNISPAIGYAAALVQAKQFPAATALLQRLLAIAPDNRTLHANLALALYELKQFPAAQKEFEWVSNADPKAATPYFFLGIIHDRMEEYVDSLAAYEQYLKLADPVANKLDIEKVELRLPVIRRLVKEGKGKKVRS
ncbi:MAG TPA: tetratricopeptide repeat protein [Pyrinomonadaceae bacterium]|nr:tetratricopeptide repeat protein [Pyrinomonadaceae bacterium]